MDIKDWRARLVEAASQMFNEAMDADDREALALSVRVGVAINQAFEEHHRQRAGAIVRTRMSEAPERWK